MRRFWPPADLIATIIKIPVNDLQKRNFRNIKW